MCLIVAGGHFVQESAIARPLYPHGHCIHLLLEKGKLIKFYFTLNVSFQNTYVDTYFVGVIKILIEH